jgi:hypothetical protein
MLQFLQTRLQHGNGFELMSTLSAMIDELEKPALIRQRFTVGY